jgi:hypothetical protein
VIVHSWSDVVYAALLVIVAALNFWHNKKIGKKADLAQIGVEDVKRATGVVKRAEDPDPPPPVPAIPDVNTPTPEVLQRRHTDTP